MQELHHTLPFLCEYSEISLKDAIIFELVCILTVVYKGIDLLTDIIDCICQLLSQFKATNTRDNRCVCTTLSDTQIAPSDLNRAIICSPLGTGVG